MDDIAHDARLLVECAPVLDAYVLGHGDLHVVHVAPVPDLLEDRVGEAEEEDVVDGFLREVMVDAVYLVLVEGAGNDPVEPGRGDAVFPEGLLDDDPRLVGPFARLWAFIFSTARETTWGGTAM